MDRPHSVNEDGLLGRTADGGAGLAELQACLHEVRQRLTVAERQRAMLREAEAAATPPPGAAGVRWEAEADGGGGATAEALRQRFAALGWGGGDDSVGGIAGAVGSGSSSPSSVANEPT